MLFQITAGTMKPNTILAMYNLIKQIKSSIPFDLDKTDACPDSCRGCSVKLIDFLEVEIKDWEFRLVNNETPNFKDLDKLAKTAKKIHRVLINNGLIVCPA
jgi:hypothetical protein